MRFAAFPGKYGIVFLTMLLAIVYALPNIYTEDPAIQITAKKARGLTADDVAQVRQTLNEHGTSFKAIELNPENILLRLNSINSQLATIKFLEQELLDYEFALNLAPVLPKWLAVIGAKPMKLGLDLRGGVRFLMDVHVDANIARIFETEYTELRTEFNEEKIRYKKFKLDNDSMLLILPNTEVLTKAKKYITRAFPHIDIKVKAEENTLILQFNSQIIHDLHNSTLEQTAATLRNRVNELGVSEAIVQRQGLDKVVVELPGVQDSTKAKDILGKTAVLEFLMEDYANDLTQALEGTPPFGSKIYYDKFGRPFLLKKQTILTGESIVGANAMIDSTQNIPVVSIRLGGTALGLFKNTTLNNIGKRLAVVYKESKILEIEDANGNVQQKPEVYEYIISIAKINSALGSSFQITGFNYEEASDLALLLRAGSLPTTISIAEERIIGPSLGQENINKGLLSVVVGLGAVLIFMALYYSIFGLLADIALVFNLILLTAILSLIGATLTLPGIAGIVLTLGMSVDANVLIFERIREELRNSISAINSIKLGFEHAFTTILDANITTLLVGIILFSIGTGPVKGFAITLCIGILTSMFTAITVTRVLIDMFYAKHNLKSLPIGI